MTSADVTAQFDTIFPTAEKATRYNKLALLAGIKRRKQNIGIFREAIAKEQEAIKYQRYIISQIDKDHPDVKILRGNIQKRYDNIQTFRKAIIDERTMIKKERAMAVNIKQNR
jgi:hypothetical protein